MNVQILDSITFATENSSHNKHQTLIILDPTKYLLVKQKSTSRHESTLFIEVSTSKVIM